MAAAGHVRRMGKAALRRFARATGHELVARNFYSPIPDLDHLSADVFERRSPLDGIDLDLDACVASLEELSPYLAEFEPPTGFAWEGSMYGPVEVDVLYAMVRHHRPGRIVELGSGSSSLIIAAAARRNAVDGRPVRYTAYDPYAGESVRQGVDGLAPEQISAVNVPMAEFEALGEGDILFIDTTHTVKLGSEVNRLVLDVLPTLRPGVLVHVHDIFLPYEYPRGFFDKGLYWGEQYLLQAFLTQNSSWDIVLPLYALWRDRPDEVARRVRSFTPQAGPGAFWMRRRPEAGTRH